MANTRGVQKWIGRVVTVAALVCIVGALALMLSINWRSTLIGVVVAALVSALFWQYVVAPAEHGLKVGTALPMEGTISLTLLANADVALYRVKDAGKNAAAFFE